MGYQSKVRVLVKGPKEDIAEVLSVIKQRAELSTIGDHYVKPEVYYKNVYEMHKRVDRSGTSVIIYDSNWFRAFGEWDEFIQDVTKICEGFGLDWSYARIGEQEDDYESDSNSPEGYIFLRREFELPILYGAVLYGEDNEA